MSDKVDGTTASPYGYPFWDWWRKKIRSTCALAGR